MPDARPPSPAATRAARGPLAHGRVPEPPEPNVLRRLAQWYLDDPHLFNQPGPNIHMQTHYEGFDKDMVSAHSFGIIDRQVNRSMSHSCHSTAATAVLCGAPGAARALDSVARRPRATPAPPPPLRIHSPIRPLPIPTTHRPTT